jgi:hypothetical protein
MKARGKYVDTKHRRSINNSSEVVGQLYPVLRDAKGKVIDGFHRLDSNPGWHSVTLDEVKTEEQRMIVAFHANLGRRSIGVKEKTRMINELAEVYFRQGLRPKVGKTIIDRDGKNRHVTVNEITEKLFKVLKGIVGKSTILKLLDSKYKDTELADKMKTAAKIRQDGTPALKLISDMFGAHIERAFGPGIFGRLEREMFDKAKADLMASEWWINKIKDQLRDEIRAEVLEKMGEAPLQMVASN